jgi:hypothetical protein
MQHDHVVPFVFRPAPELEDEVQALKNAPLVYTSVPLQPQTPDASMCIMGVPEQGTKEWPLVCWPEHEELLQKIHLTRDSVHTMEFYDSLVRSFIHTTLHKDRDISALIDAKKTDVACLFVGMVPAAAVPYVCFTTTNARYVALQPNDEKGAFEIIDPLEFVCTSTTLARSTSRTNNMIMYVKVQDQQTDSVFVVPLLFQLVFSGLQNTQMLLNGLQTVEQTAAHLQRGMDATNARMARTTSDLTVLAALQGYLAAKQTAVGQRVSTPAEVRVLRAYLALQSYATYFHLISRYGARMRYARDWLNSNLFVMLGDICNEIERPHEQCMLTPSHLALFSDVAFSVAPLQSPIEKIRRKTTYSMLDEDVDVPMSTADAENTAVNNTVCTLVQTFQAKASAQPLSVFHHASKDARRLGLFANAATQTLSDAMCSVFLQCYAHLSNKRAADDDAVQSPAKRARARGQFAGKYKLTDQEIDAAYTKFLHDLDSPAFVD